MKFEQFLASLKSSSQWFALYGLAVAISITLILSSCGRNENSTTAVSGTHPQTRNAFVFGNPVVEPSKVADESNQRQPYFDAFTLEKNGKSIPVTGKQITKEQSKGNSNEKKKGYDRLKVKPPHCVLYVTGNYYICTR